MRTKARRLAAVAGGLLLAMSALQLLHPLGLRGAACHGLLGLGVGMPKGGILQRPSEWVRVTTVASCSHLFFVCDATVDCGPRSGPRRTLRDFAAAHPDF